jgi:pimeloyl-ACP methyl ester carboxylesterase
MKSLCLALLVAVGFLAPSGCSLWRLRKDVVRREEMAMIGGRVSRARDDGAPIVVVLSTGRPAAIVDTFVLEHAGAYFFVVPAGTYRVAPFVDDNRDFTYQPDSEPGAYYGAPTDVPVAPGQRVTAVDLTVAREPRVRLDFPIAVRDLGKRGTHELPPIQLGDVVTLDDPRFSEANAHLGMWQPVEFLFQVGGGFYFLQPFDATKIPVLFVHGAGGQPDNWRYLIAHLDRTKFQPWVVYYPSGLGLDDTGRGVARWLNVLAARYRFPRLIIVAHSMGGLVSRAAINYMTANGVGDMLALFVTLSTPWDGHAAATRGAEDSPVVMPMWTDVVPGSPFIRGLFQAALPRDCPYFLLFSFRGSRSFVLDEQNDGVVALSSELAPYAQQAAQRIYGFTRVTPAS